MHENDKQKKGTPQQPQKEPSYLSLKTIAIGVTVFMLGVLAPITAFLTYCLIANKMLKENWKSLGILVLMSVPIAFVYYTIVIARGFLFTLILSIAIDILLGIAIYFRRER